MVNGAFGNYDFGGVATLNSTVLAGKTIYYEVEAKFGGTSGLNGYVWESNSSYVNAQLTSAAGIPAACAQTPPACHVYYGFKAAISASPINLYWQSGSNFYFYTPFWTPSGVTPPNTDSDIDDVFMVITN